MSDKCYNCGAPLGNPIAGRDWDAVCPECGRLIWLRVGDIVTCKVSRVARYGVMVELANTMDGMIHISELTTNDIIHPGEVVAVGNLLRAKVIRIDVEQKKVGLSVKRVEW